MTQAATLDTISARSETAPRPLPREPQSTRHPETREAPAPSGSKPTAAPAETPKKKPSRAKFVALGLALLAAGGGGTAYAVSHGHETTDDAQVEGHVQTVAARTSGQVSEVLVKDNDVVEAGQIVAVLDKTDLEAKVELAKADVASADAAIDAANAQLSLTEQTTEANLKQAKGGLKQASGGLVGSQASVEQAKADVDSADARTKLAQNDYDRIKALFDANAVSKAELDSRSAALDQATANLSSTRARLTAAQAAIASNAGNLELAEGKLSSAQTGPAQLAAAKASVESSEARKKQAEASLHIAELNLGYADVRAPVRGVVSKRTVEVGQMASPDRALMAIVPLDDVWVVANFKETQLENMRMGQPVEVSVDAFGGTKLHGHVESFASGTGSKFSLLPPDNSSGNFVKVVQRVPTLVRLDDPPAKLELRPGMSVSVDVTTK